MRPATERPLYLHESYAGAVPAYRARYRPGPVTPAACARHNAVRAATTQPWRRRVPGPAPVNTSY